MTKVGNRRHCHESRSAKRLHHAMEHFSWMLSIRLAQPLCVQSMPSPHHPSNQAAPQRKRPPTMKLTLRESLPHPRKAAQLPLKLSSELCLPTRPSGPVVGGRGEFERFRSIKRRIARSRMQEFFSCTQTWGNVRCSLQPWTCFHTMVRRGKRAASSLSARKAVRPLSTSENVAIVLSLAELS